MVWFSSAYVSLRPQITVPSATLTGEHFCLKLECWKIGETIRCSGNTPSRSNMDTYLMKHLTHVVVNNFNTDDMFLNKHMKNQTLISFYNIWLICFHVVQIFKRGTAQCNTFLKFQTIFNDWDTLFGITDTSVYQTVRKAKHIEPKAMMFWVVEVKWYKYLFLKCCFSSCHLRKIYF